MTVQERARLTRMLRATLESYRERREQLVRANLGGDASPNTVPELRWNVTRLAELIDRLDGRVP